MESIEVSWIINTILQILDAEDAEFLVQFGIVQNIKKQAVKCAVVYTGLEIGVACNDNLWIPLVHSRYPGMK